MVPGPPEESWANVGELRISYLDWGGEGLPVLALHGLASSGHWYERVAARLGPSYRIIAPTLAQIAMSFRGNEATEKS